MAEIIENTELYDAVKVLYKASKGINTEGSSLIDTAFEKYHWGPETLDLGAEDRTDPEDDSVIRISKIRIENFKGVKYGEIDLKHGKKSFTPSSKSDILGIYGQNGSGKSAVVEAIKLMKSLVSGNSFTNLFGVEKSYINFSQYAEWINKDSDEAHFVFQFDYIENDETIRTIEYSFYLGRLKEQISYVNRSKVYDELRQYTYENFLFKHSETAGFVFGETISMSGQFEGKKIKMQPVIDASKLDILFTPASKMKYIVGDLTDEEKKALNTLKMSQGISGSSFIFSILFSTLNNDYAKTMRRLRIFARRELSIIGNDGLNMFESSTTFADEIFPIYTPGGKYSFCFIDSTLMYSPIVDDFKKFIESINPVLDRVIPGIKLVVETEDPLPNQKDVDVIDEITNEDGVFSGDVFVDLYVEKNGNKVPYRCESIGTRRLISEISMFVDAYNDPKQALIIDEFDSGIFEFLLGELLQIFEESGKGQFIFTSHNLRPLEVLDKKCICFTTTNPENRYFRLKNIGQTNNLRSTYFREILLGDQDEELYNSTKKHKLMAAMKRVGK